MSCEIRVRRPRHRHRRHLRRGQRGQAAQVQPHQHGQGRDRVKELRELAARRRGRQGRHGRRRGSHRHRARRRARRRATRASHQARHEQVRDRRGHAQPVGGVQQRFASMTSVSAARARPRRQRHECDVVFMRGDGTQHQLPGGGSLKAAGGGFVKTGPRRCSVSASSGMRRRATRRRDGDDERAVPARARHREVRAEGVRRTSCGIAGRRSDKAARRGGGTQTQFGAAVRGSYVSPVAVMSLSPSDSVGYVQGAWRGWYMAARKRKDLWRMRLSKKLTGHDGPHYT